MHRCFRIIIYLLSPEDSTGYSGTNHPSGLTVQLKNLFWFAMAIALVAGLGRLS